VRPDEADLVASLGELARRWQSASFITRQGKPWSRYAVKDVLTNPRYAGLRRHRTSEGAARSALTPSLESSPRRNGPL